MQQPAPVEHAVPAQVGGWQRPLVQVRPLQQSVAVPQASFELPQYDRHARVDEALPAQNRALAQQRVPVVQLRPPHELGVVEQLTRTSSE